MNVDVHERARMLIALAGPEELAARDRMFLADHLDACAECREFADTAAEAVRSLRTIPISAGWSLVSATRSRVRQRALELQRHREWMMAAWICCIAVTVCTALATAGLWSSVAWLAELTRLPSPAWELLLAASSLLPAVFAAILLLARGTHLSDQNWEG